MKIREFKLELETVVDPDRMVEFNAAKGAWLRDNAADLKHEHMHVKGIEVEAETGKVLVTVEVLEGIVIEAMP